MKADAGDIGERSDDGAGEVLDVGGIVSFDGN